MGNLKYYIPLSIIAMLLISKTSQAATTASIIAAAPPAGTNDWTRFDDLFKKYAAQYNVEWTWLKAFALNESSLGKNKSVALGMIDPTNPASVSFDKKSWGLMQFLVSTANDYVKGTTFADLNDPEKAIKIAAMHIAWMIKQFPDDEDDALLKKVVLSYNQGVGNTKKGNDYTGPYYSRFMTNLKLVESRDT